MNIFTDRAENLVSVILAEFALQLIKILGIFLSRCGKKTVSYEYSETLSDIRKYNFGTKLVHFLNGNITSYINDYNPSLGISSNPEIVITPGSLATPRFNFI